MTMCSGIGAPELAAPWVDWRLASEIEPFPRAVLQARFGYRLPEDHNQGDALLWGDMTEITPDLLRSRGIPLPDLLIAGTPCQAFSIAGLRKGTEDARGNLTLKFVEICHELVAARPDGKLAVVWENVPGILSDKNNAFGCFLGGLVGAVDTPQPPADGRWPGEGMVEGPRARAAWSVLDAQYFGVAQRRRRVFVVVDFGNCVDPAAILLEPDSLRGNTPPRRETGQNPAARTAECFGGGRQSGSLNVAAALTAHGVRQDFDVETFVTHALRGEGFDASEDGTGRGTPIVPVAFDCKGTEVQYTEDDSHPTLRSMGHNQSHQNAGDDAAIAEPFTLMERGRNGVPNLEYRQDGTSNAILTPNGGRSGLGVGAVAFAENSRSELRLCGGDGNVSSQLTTGGGKPGQGHACIAEPLAVRRLTPRECERLQGMPDDHTLISWRGKDPTDCPDGPRYKAIGNSMAVPVMKWIINRVKISHDQHRSQSST
jgi:DNA (cytosine-5)-methyltransferase 1